MSEATVPAAAVSAPPTAAPNVRLIFAADDGAAARVARPDDVSTALPTIVGDLGGVSKLSWVVREYLDGLEPDDHPELQRLLDELAHDVVGAIPTPTGVA